MDDAIREKYFRMYDKEGETSAETDYKPDIATTPQIEVDKRQYTRSTNIAKKITPTNNTPNNVSNNTIQNNLPNNFPNYNPIKIPGRKFSINGKSIGEFIKDVIYYNPSNPLDPGNYADAVAIGAVTSEKYGKGPLEKIVIVAGVTVAAVKAKDYLYGKFVK
jgi:hypothetical protein